jgi:dihydropteroate synthase
VDERLSGSLATAAIAVWNGAKIVRVHDVKETVETLKIVRAVRDQL